MSEPLPPELPRSVIELAKVAGLVATLKLVEEYGGTYFFAPKRLDENHDLVKLIGLEPARAVVKKYAGELVRVPRCVEYVRAERNRLMIVDCDAGLSGAELARKYQLSLRQVWYILKGDFTPDSGQGNLF